MDRHPGPENSEKRQESEAKRPHLKSAGEQSPCRFESGHRHHRIAASPIMIDSDNWYYHEDGLALGPFSHRVMESRFHEGAIHPDTLLWNPLQDKWVPLSDLKPSWSQSLSSPIFQPGPLRIPMVPNPQTRETSDTQTAPTARHTLKPLAGADATLKPKQGFLKRLFGRKS